MQTSKFPLWICALALCGGLTLQAEDTPAQAAARAALLQKLQESDSTPAPAPETPAPATPPPAAVAVPAPTEKPAPVVTPAPAAAPVAASPAAEPTVVQPGDTEAQARARAALNEKMAEIGTPAPAPTTASPSPSASSVPAAAPGFKPITAPALPINMSKAGKLDWLLSLYKSDQISPEQYHKQRAEILAEP